MPPFNKLGPVGSLLKAAASATNLTPTGIAGSIARKVGGTAIQEVGRALAPGVFAPGKELADQFSGQQDSEQSAQKDLKVTVNSGNLNSYMGDVLSSIMQNYHLPDLRNPTKVRDCINHLNAMLPIGRWTVTSSGNVARLSLRSLDNRHVINFTIS